MIQKKTTISGSNITTKNDEKSISITPAGVNMSISGDVYSYSLINYDRLHINTSKLSTQITPGIIELINPTNGTKSLIRYDYITSFKFVKKGATSSQFLMGDGSVTEFNKANGVPKLDANGKLDSAQIVALSNSDIDAIVI